MRRWKGWKNFSHFEAWRLARTDQSRSRLRVSGLAVRVHPSRFGRERAFLAECQVCDGAPHRRTTYFGK